MHPRRYEIGSDGRIVLVGLSADETLVFELLEQSISSNNDHDEFDGQPSVTRLLDWLELYHKQYKATNRALPETDSAFANDPSPPRAIRLDQPPLTRSRPQSAHAVRRAQVKFVAMALTGMVVLFVAGVALMI
jgi:hypothetical protein